jgi:hypothetical protein
MFRLKVHYILLLFFICIQSTVFAEMKNVKTDQICQLLFDTYIVRQRKIDAESIMAASHLIAVRGRNNGFWQNVLRELQRNNKDSEIGTVRILGKMLSIDAVARDVISREKETGEIGQWKASVCLGQEVVEELISRGKKADRFCINHYAIALARARIPETVNLFRMIIRNDNGKNYMSTAQFYAAVGLAQLGDTKGIEWLIENSENVLPIVSSAWPVGAADGNLSTCCITALRILAGEKKLTKKSEWEDWWQTAREGFQPKSHIRIVDLFAQH